MDKPSYVKHTGPGPIPEDLFNTRGLPQVPFSLSDCDDIIAARLKMIALFSRFDFIDKHEAQLALDMKDPTFKLSTRTRQSWANEIRRQVGPSIVLEGLFAGARALEVDCGDNRTEIVKEFVGPLELVIKAILNNEAVKALLRPYSLEPPDEHAIRATTKNAALPSFRAALCTNKFGLEFSLDKIMSKQPKELDCLKLAHLQWTTIRNFKIWAEESASKNFSMVTLDVLEKHVVMIEDCLKRIEILENDSQTN